MKSAINADGVDIRSYTFNKEISPYICTYVCARVYMYIFMRERRYPLSSTASGLPAHQCAGRIASTGEGKGRLVGCASATRVLRVVITRHLQPARTTLRPPPPSPLPPPTCPTALDGIGGGGEGD